MGEELTVRLWRLLNDASERCALNSNELCLLDEARVEILRLQGYQRVAAELSDKLNGTPCAEIRWDQERERLQGDADRVAFLDRTFFGIKVRNGRRYDAGPGNARYIIDAAKAYHEPSPSGTGGRGE